MRVRELGEFGLIGRLRALIDRPDDRVHVGIGDDAAVVAGGRSLVLTADALVEGVHFRRDWISGFAVGYRALAASLSDVAAMGGRPLYALVTLCLSPDEDVEMIEQIYRGMAELADACGVRVVGGDVVRTPGPLVLAVTVTGELLGDRPLTRSGARPDDWIFVTGDLGGAAVFVDRMSTERGVVMTPEDEWVVRLRHERPQPQLLAAEILSRPDVQCTSLNDISDGLASELHELAEASGVSLLIDAERLPSPAAVRNYARSVRRAASDFMLFGGEDFQLVGTVSEASAGNLLAHMEAGGVRCTCIGRVRAGSSGVALRTADGVVSVPKGGYDHFTDGGSL